MKRTTEQIKQDIIEELHRLNCNSPPAEWKSVHKPPLLQRGVPPASPPVSGGLSSIKPIAGIRWARPFRRRQAAGS